MMFHRSPTPFRPVACLLALLLPAAIALGQEAPKLYNVAQSTLGASAIGTGAPFNKDWPAANAIREDGPRPLRGGTLFGAPMKGGRVDIRLLIPVDIKAIETVALDYNLTRQPKAIDIYVDGKLVKQTELPDTPGKAVRIPVEAHGRVVGIVVTDEYPLRPRPTGGTGPNYGGWQRIRVLSTTDLAPLMKSPDAYQVAALPAAIAPTSGALVEGVVKVHGEPRNNTSNPRTYWDKTDIEHFKALLKTSPLLKQQYETLKKSLDDRITRPLGVPEPKQDAEGKWIHISDQVDGRGRTHNALSLDIANLGMIYALSGEEKYAEFAKKLLLAYAEAYPKYGVGARSGFNHDPSKIFDQRLGDATWLIPVAKGYDLIYHLPSITADERRIIEDDLLKACANFIAANRSMLIGATNWSAIAVHSILVTGYATNDEALVNLARWGRGGTPEKPTGGVHLHFSTRCIGPDGLWSEGSSGYQFMAMAAMVANAEVLWRNGVDMYGYRDAALKRLFDSPIQLAYPNLATPATEDGGGGSIVGYYSSLYEFAYARYRDPRYLMILDRANLNLAQQFQMYVVSFLYDRDPAIKAPPLEFKSVNFFDIGYGITRLTDQRGLSSLLMDTGPNRSHGHADKLNIDLYAFGQRLIPDPGSVWYEQPLYRQWYATTLAHNTVVVDERNQTASNATQLVYGSAETFAIQRGATDKAYSGITMDRAVFHTTDYVADAYVVLARLPRLIDLPWHFIGELTTSLPMAPHTFAAPVAAGYSALDNVRSATTDQPFTADIQAKKGLARFLVAGGDKTQIIVGDGHLGRDRPPTVILRRADTSQTIFGSVVDISGSPSPFVKSIEKTGSLEAGYALLTVNTERGADLCFSALRPGTYEAGALTTDAQQALVLMDKDTVKAMFLGGGTQMQVGSVSLKRSEAGLAYIERVPTGAFIVGNPSEAEATITVQHPAVVALKAYQLDLDGRRSGEAEVQRTTSGQVALKLKAAARVEFAPEGVLSGFDARQKLLREREEALKAAEAKALAESRARFEARKAEAAKLPAPAGSFLIVPAESFTAQGNGNVAVADNKTGSVGKSFARWDGSGHWLEYTVDAPADGYYALWLTYCSLFNEVSREITVNGAVVDSFTLEGTGGWSNGIDQWRLAVAAESFDAKQPILIRLKKGQNVMRLTNIDGNGLNLNYLVFTSPDVAPTRAEAAKRLAK